MVSSDKEQITEVLMKYRDALNTSSTEAAVKLYAPDGVIMAQHFQTQIGTEAIRKQYDVFFNMISFDVKFNVVEVVPFSSDWAFARTTSAGTTTSVKGGGKNSEGNQELFVFQKVDGVWKIARYSFSTTNPPH
ncbi:MAG: hypothetical protein M1827_000421 [Pycnora praestabilis]|nr:MAG: hypothetical protein M1827_000421 [Pycnora praestabilis]